MMAGGITPLIRNTISNCQNLKWTPQKTDITKIMPSKKIKKTEAQKINNLVVYLMIVFIIIFVSN